MKKYMMTVLSVLLVCFSVSTVAKEKISTNERMNFGISSRPLVEVLKIYEELSGGHVDVVAGIFSSRITIQTQGVTVEEQLKLIEKELCKNGIGLFCIGDNRVVATWIEPVEDLARKYLNHCKENKIAPDMAPVKVNSYIPQEIIDLENEKDVAFENLSKIRMKDGAYFENSKAWKGILNKVIEEKKKSNK